MRTFSTLALATMFLLGACTDDEQVGPRPPVGPEDVAGQDFSFKVKAEDWVTHGTPGDDTHGYMVIGDVNIITEGIAANGVVRVYLKRANNSWAELPLLASQGAPGGVNWRFTYRTNMVQIFIDRNGESFSPPEELLVFKVVAFANHGLEEGPAFQ